MDWPAIIRNVTGMSQEDYNRLEYEAGQEFLEMMEGDNPALLAHLERSYQYWNWWRRQFWRLCREFINRNGIEICRRTNKDFVRERLESYCRIVKISDYGVTSYGHLVQNIELGKQQTANQKSADNGNNDCN